METKSNIEKTILVPTDFSEVCDNALNHALELGKFLKSKVIVLHVIDSFSKNFVVTQNINIDTISNNSNEQDFFRTKLQEYVNSKNADNLESLLQEGDLFESIQEAASEKNAQLIVLGTHGKIGFQKLFGSYALKVIDSSKVPVIIVHKNQFNNGYKNIVFPISLDEEDRQKTEYAIKIAALFNSTIHVLPKHEDINKNKTKMSIVINQITGYFSNYNIDFKIINSAEYGDSWNYQILNYSKSIDADLILILSNPEKHMMFFDAKEENIIFNSAQIPVMCINYKKTKISSFWGSYTSDKTNVY